MTPSTAAVLATYNHWINTRLYALCAELTDAERKQDRGAFFKSIHGTLNHILLADLIWLGRFQNKPFTATGLDQELHSDFEALRAARASTDSRIEQWAAGLDTATLSGILHYTSLVNPAPRSYPYSITVTHFFNHQTHHRGQITTLLSQLGKDIGVTDLIGMPGVESNVTGR